MKKLLKFGAFAVALLSFSMANAQGSQGENVFTLHAGFSVTGGLIKAVFTDAEYIDSTGTVQTGTSSVKGGPAATRYVTKKVVLEGGFDSGDLNVYLSAYRPLGTDVNVYYKVLSRNDTQTFDEGYWQLMTKTNSCDGTYSQSREDLREYTFAPGTLGKDQGFVSYVSNNGQTYYTFSQFAIKIVLTTTDKTIVPHLSDMRTIALPPNTNTIF